MAASTIPPITNAEVEIFGGGFTGGGRHQESESPEDITMIVTTPRAIQGISSQPGESPAL
jgi:hypothetical protein